MARSFSGYGGQCKVPARVQPARTSVVICVPRAILDSAPPREHSMWKREFERQASKILASGGSVGGYRQGDNEMIRVEGVRHMVEALYAHVDVFVYRWTPGAKPERQDLRILRVVR